MRPDDPAALQAAADALAEELDVSLGGVGSLDGYELHFASGELVLLVDADDVERVRSVLVRTLGDSDAIDAVDELI